jgi:hypothetical protein
MRMWMRDDNTEDNDKCHFWMKNELRLLTLITDCEPIARAQKLHK